MPDPKEDNSDRRRSRWLSDSQSPDSDRQRRPRHDDDYDGSSHKHGHRSSRNDSPRRRSSRSPSTRTRHRREYERRHPERSERIEDSEDCRRRHRRHSPKESSRRQHRDRDAHSHKERSSRRYRSYSRSRSPDRRSQSPSSRALTRPKSPLPSQQDAYKSEASRGDGDAPPPEKEKPNFANTGRLAAESNTVNVNGGTVVLKYHEPPEARKPPAKESWRLYVFKGKDLLEMVELNERSCWLVGRERLVVDFSLDHPSCSKQHAAIQFRFVEKKNEFGDRIGKVKPYLIDLESANGSSVNGDSVPAGRYVELRDKDMVQFGSSSREYVLMLTQPD